MPTGNDPLQVLAAAVTPVVLVSATAILVSGVNSRYISYASVGCFITVAMVISATLWKKPLEAVTLPLFTTGILMILAAIIFQLLELHLSNRTIALEVRDITAD